MEEVVCYLNDLDLEQLEEGKWGLNLVVENQPLASHLNSALEGALTIDYSYYDVDNLWVFRLIFLTRGQFCRGTFRVTELSKSIMYLIDKGSISSVRAAYPFDGMLRPHGYWRALTS